LTEISIAVLAHSKFSQLAFRCLSGIPKIQNEG
jgi:hypothetical protein